VNDAPREPPLRGTSDVTYRPIGVVDGVQAERIGWFEGQADLVRDVRADGRFDRDS
jgi:hypothetical protein